MKIAICDDTQSDLENLKNCLVEYFNEKQIPFSIDGILGVLVSIFIN